MPGQAPTYTAAELRERKMQRERDRRTKFINAGLNSHGLPRSRNPRKVVKRQIQNCAKSKPAHKPSIPAQSVDDYLAHGGRIEVLPTFAYTLPRLLPMNGARIGTRAA